MNRQKNIAEMLKSLLSRMSPSQAVANLLIECPWLDTDDLEGALFIAEVDIRKSMMGAV